MKQKVTEADSILSDVYQRLNLTDRNDAEKYARINDIVQELQKKNSEQKIDVKPTGTISERLCELALRAAVPPIYSTLGRDWKWIGDFSILGNPFNLIVSVKSFKAKERLMASGSGNILSPTIAWGLFDDVSEWSENRVKGYLYRAFIAVYMPHSLYDRLSDKVKTVLNINNKPFLRDLSDFIADMRNAVINNKIDVRKI